MANMLAGGADWLDRKRHEKLSSDVTYQRASGGPFTVKATIGRTASDQLAEAEFVVGGPVRDYLVRATDLEVAGELLPPRRGDVISDADGDQWEVAEIGGEECWRWSTEYKHAIRVHTVKK